VTLETQRNEIALRIISLTTSKLGVVDLQIRHRAADLASPAIALKHLQAKPLIGIDVQANTHRFGQTGHAASVTSARNSSFWTSGRNRNKRSTEHKSTLGLPFSTCAPAKKSAQIISRQ
jgi:hypothetical protein